MHKRWTRRHVRSSNGDRNSQFVIQLRFFGTSNLVDGHSRRFDPRSGEMKLRYQRGASMVEFAIACTTFLLVLFGIVEFARVLYLYHTVSNAARLGTRWAIVRGSGCTVLDHCNATSSDIQTYVQSVVPLVDTTSSTVSGCSSAGLCITATWSSGTGSSAACDSATPSGNNSQGHVVCVTAAYPFNFAVPFVSTNALTLSSTSQMVISN